MIACTVRFLTRTAHSPQTQTQTSEGFLERTESGYAVSYRISGDEACFVVSRGELFMERKGEFPLKAQFLSGRDSLIFTAYQGATGEIPVHTDGLRISERDGRLAISLEYRIGGTYAEHIRLKIFITFSEVL